MVSLSDMSVQEAKSIKKKFDDRIAYFKNTKKSFTEQESELTKKARVQARKDKDSQKVDGKKQTDAEDRAEQITLNIRPTSEGAPFTIKVQKGSTIRSMKILMMKHIHGEEGEKKSLSRAKKIRMIHTNQNKEIENSDSHHRTTCRNFGLQDGHTITINAVGLGGGKRGSSSVGVKSKEEFNASIMEEIDILSMRIQTVGSASPHIESVLSKIMDIKNGIIAKKSVFPLLLNLINEQTVAQLMAEVLPASSKPLERSKKVATILFNQDLKNLEEVRIQRAKVVEALGNTIHMAIIEEYGDKYCNVSWEAFSQDLVKRSKVSKTPSEEGKP